MTTYHHGDLRTAILEAAGRVIDEKGVAGLSVREAARRAGVSHGAPYRHFSDREALLSALAAADLQLLMETLEGLKGKALAEAYVRFALERPRRFRLMFDGRRHGRLEERFGEAFAELGPLAGAAALSLAHGLAELLLGGHFNGDELLALRVLDAVRFAQRSA